MRRLMKTVIFAEPRAAGIVGERIFAGGHGLDISPQPQEAYEVDVFIG
jgi:hypothetical protein